MLKLKSTDSQKIYWSSDFHIQHLNLYKGTSQWTDKSGCRDFNTPQEGWEVIRDNVNRLVRPCDIILNLGDIIFGDKSKLPQYLREINCKNWLYVKGNHCDWLDKQENLHYKCQFTLGCYDFKEVSINGVIFILSHYAMRTWRNQGKGAIQTFGHSHNTLPDDPTLLSMDVGCDVDLFDHEKYTPFSFSEIMHIMSKYKQPKCLDHHIREN